MRKKCFRCATDVEPTDAGKCSHCGAPLLRIVDGGGPQRELGGGHQLTKPGFLSEAEQLQYLSRRFGVPAVFVEQFEIDREVLDLITGEMARRLRVVPVNRVGKVLVICVDDLSNLNWIEEVRQHTGMAIEVCVTPPFDLDAALTRCFPTV